MTVTALLPFAASISGGVVGLGLALRNRRALAGWMFFAGMGALAAEAFCYGKAQETMFVQDTLYWLRLKLLVLSLLPGFWLVFSLCYARGNSGEFLAKWKIPSVIAFLLPLGVALAFPQKLAVSLQPFSGGREPILLLGWPGILLHIFLLIGSVLVLMNLERTFRASVGTMRWRIKFTLLGVGVLFVVRIYTSSQVLLFRSADLSLESLNSGAVLVACALVLRSFFRTRTGRLELEVYPSQSLLQGSLTVLVAGVYLFIVGVFAKAVTYLGGDAAFPLKALVVLLSLVLLAVLLQSDRVRLHLRRFVSRHFQRPLYDYRTVWKKFTEGTASRVEQTDLCRAVVRLVADMFQSLSVSMWLVDDKKESLVLAASTSLTVTSAASTVPRVAEAAAVIIHFQAQPEPIDIETAEGAWAALLRECHPGQFESGGNRICIPLIGRGELLGVVTLGDRVGGASFSLQDFDMLKCVGDHAAASLLNVQLSQRLMQAKELEAFQTMAAFFVHDLKNAASTLNLMLQNLPVHFDDPAFREDALRGISKTVTHVNHLIGRLSLLRHELKIQTRDADLNDVVVKILAGIEAGPDFTMTRQLGNLTKIPIDQDQFGKVVTNLVLNARESMSGKGEIRVTTEQAQGWAVLTVTDTGCGMTADFLQRSLFRPFQTTKKSGLGIGMFQSKMIVEAHGGRITVASAPGKGTTFQVFLPTHKTVQSTAP
jgi:putative PEP-CTERM system histidine kinase